MTPVLAEPHHSLLFAVNKATRKLSGSLPLNDVLPEVLSLCVEAAGAEGGTIYLHNKANQTLEFRHVLPESSKEALQFTDIADDYGTAGRVFQTRETDISVFEPKEDDQFARKTGVSVRSMITVPLTIEDMEPIGVVQLINKRDGNFGEEDRAVLETVSAVSTMAYLNAQLLSEQTRASQLLGMGQVSHDIKNMAFALKAIVNMSSDTLRVASELAEQEEDGMMGSYLDELEIGNAELSRSINRVQRYTTILSDLSAGKTLEPELAFEPMAEAIQKAVAMEIPQARRRGVTVEYELDSEAPPVLHDEMFVYRITQNLVSNAVKAVAESRGDEADGLVNVRYAFKENSHVLEVQDNGPGMSEQTAASILSGNARSFWNKSSGSGWGTKIVLELAATHQAEVEIDSALGAGTTFRVTFPHRSA